jgi:ribosomal protein S18 acetylase RimI-like enzyme
MIPEPRRAIHPKLERPGMPLVVCEADYSDPVHARGIVAVLDSYARDPRGGGLPLRAEVRERLVPALRVHPTALVLLALADPGPVGVAVCFLGFSTFEARPLLNVHDLAVLPEHRGRGVGRALLAGVEQRARTRGCCKLTLEVQDDNEPARRLYARFGFQNFALGEDPVPTRFLAKWLERTP